MWEIPCMTVSIFFIVFEKGSNPWWKKLHYSNKRGERGTTTCMGCFLF